MAQGCPSASPLGVARWGSLPPSHRTLAHCHEATGSPKPPCPHIPSRQGAMLHPLVLLRTGVGGEP